jgi:hypothetical protein
MGEAALSSRSVRFGTFEVDLHAGELRKGGLKVKLTGQPFSGSRHSAGAPRPGGDPGRIAETAVAGYVR